MTWTKPNHDNAIPWRLLRDEYEVICDVCGNRVIRKQRHALEPHYDKCIECSKKRKRFKIHL